jgi:hypothetical protein
MRPGGGKQKGADYERQVCKALSLWVSHGKREDLYWRSAMSGGRATVGRKKGLDLAQHAGDITATHPDGHALTDHFYVECKRYADLNFGSFLTKGVGPLAGFWVEAVKQAAVHDRIPMLIVRQDRGDTLLIVPCEAMLTRGLTGHVFKFAPDAWIARLMRLKIDLFEFEEAVKKPFEIPSRYAITDSMLKPGELQHILRNGAPPLAKLTVVKMPVRSMAGTLARAKQGDAMIGDDEDNEVSFRLKSPRGETKIARVKL